MRLDNKFLKSQSKKNLMHILLYSSSPFKFKVKALFYLVIQLITFENNKKANKKANKKIQ